jgi:hypothetical protein
MSDGGLVKDIVPSPASPVREGDRRAETASASPLERWAHSCGAALNRPWFSVAIVIAMLVIGYAVRRSALPTTSLWFDDAWVAAGAMHFTPSQLIVAGSAHPGFTVTLRLFDDVVSGDVGRLAYLPLAAGCVAAPCMYLWLRSLRFARSISLLLAVPLVIGKIPVLYSGRVKPYTLDVVLVIAVFVALPRLAAMTWRWPTAAAWVGGAVIAGSFSGNVMLTTALAAGVLVLHPVGDRVVRVAAVAVQGALQLLLYTSYARASDLDGIERFMDSYDGHVDVHANPIDFLDEVLTHMARIAEVHPGGSGVALRLVALAALSGLVIGAIRPHRRAEALSSRLALGLFLFAFVASLFDRFPFGPSGLSLFFPGVSPGSRHSLWLAPIFALGLAVSLSRISRRLTAARPVFHGAAIAASVAVLVLGYGRPYPYPSDEAPQAARVVDEWAASADAVIIVDTRVYAYALYTSEPVVLVPTPTHQVGFTPAMEDERFHGLGAWSERPLVPESIRAIVDDATEVVVYDAVIGPGSDKFVAPVMSAEGFTAVDARMLGGNNVVTAWRREQTLR